MIRLSRLASLFPLVLSAGACDTASHSPTAVAVVSSMQVVTPHGTASVQLAVPCATSSEAEIRSEVRQGYRRATAEAPEAASVPLEPLTIQVLARRDQAVWFTPPEDVVEYGCGDEGAVEHEMGHRIAHFLGRPCVPDVWHTVDLNCDPL